jgi:hypothetical protein
MHYDQYRILVQNKNCFIWRKFLMVRDMDRFIALASIRLEVRI